MPHYQTLITNDLNLSAIHLNCTQSFVTEMLSGANNIYIDVLLLPIRWHAIPCRFFFLIFFFLFFSFFVNLQRHCTDSADIEGTFQTEF